MHTFCKPADVNILDPEFNVRAVSLAFTPKKLRKHDFQQLLVDTGAVSFDQLKQDLQNQDLTRIYVAIGKVSETLTQRIADGDLRLRPINQFSRLDGISGKVRTLSRESAEQQIYEYIAVGALTPLFNAKILPCQHGSLPGRGPNTGVHDIEKYIRRHSERLCCLKMDVRHAYESTTVETCMRLLRRDIGKNKKLLSFLEMLMANYPGDALVIGGYLPTWLFNYAMSHAIREHMECGQVRRDVKTKYVQHIVCYADDVAIFGKPSQLKKAYRHMTKWMPEHLGLNLKPNPSIWYLMSFEEEKAERAKARKENRRPRIPGIDMMGYVINRHCTTIRRRTFLKIRRQYLRAARDLETLGYIPWWRAQKIASYYGYLKNSNSEAFMEKYNAETIMKAARHSLSWHARKENSR